HTGHERTGRSSIRSGRRTMKSIISKRSIIVSGQKTSVSLEDAFWNALKEIAYSRLLTLSDLVTAIDANREHGNLSSAIRLFVLTEFRDQISLTQVQERQNGRIRGTNAGVGA